ncbi:hypothetical protein CDAR_402731 [Caerostris darwini]|uniref:Uncharacterized protein n=1 Tax=Caerostris darwini TaxID=1538125 RepID=A0AAV4SW20_9ARAC|nr:hypothetical protein CDAR_402731 [Caerostris darwini]
MFSNRLRTAPYDDWGLLAELQKTKSRRLVTNFYLQDKFIDYTGKMSSTDSNLLEQQQLSSSSHSLNSLLFRVTR